MRSSWCFETPDRYIYAVDDVPHFIFECDASHARLNQFWGAMSHVDLERLMCEMRGMSATERAKFVLRF